MIFTLFDAEVLFVSGGNLTELMISNSDLAKLQNQAESNLKYTHTPDNNQGYTYTTDSTTVPNMRRAPLVIRNYPVASTRSLLPSSFISQAEPLADKGRTMPEVEVGEFPLPILEMPVTDDRWTSGCGSITLDCPIGQLRRFRKKSSNFFAVHN